MIEVGNYVLIKKEYESSFKEELIGILFAEPLPGRKMSLIRKIYNMQSVTGLLYTSKIKTVEELPDGSMLVATNNTVYRLTKIGNGYASSKNSAKVLEQFRKVETRGRYKSNY